jgi:hypothetical protein
MIESTSEAQETKSGKVARNLTTHSTGARVSRSLIVELSLAVLNARPVNSGVGRLLQPLYIHGFQREVISY